MGKGKRVPAYVGERKRKGEKEGVKLIDIYIAREREQERESKRAREREREREREQERKHESVRERERDQPFSIFTKNNPE